ncbi:MAG: amidohydrolase family protein [Candidatus Binataceae bacterium]
MTLPFKLVSADSHVVEPPDLWTSRLDKRFRDRAPRMVSREQGDVFICEGALAGDEHGQGLIATKRKYEKPESYDFGHEGGRWSEVPEPAYDPAERIKENDREGVEAELMYTSHGLIMYAIPDREFRFACFQAFNNWLGEFCAAAPKRLFGIAMIPTDDIDRAVSELERCAKMGYPGAMVSIDHGSGETYVDSKYSKLWTAAESLDMPISLHTAASEQGSLFVTGSMFVNFSCGFSPTMYAIVSMIFEGLFDNHRKLKVISVENDASWALAVLERMDDRWKHDKSWAGQAGLTSGRTPSQIFHAQVACSFMRDRTAIVNRDIIGKHNIMWGSDYPHFDGAWPKQAEQLERQFAGVPLEDQIRIGRTNAIEFYRLPLAGC